MSVSTILRRGAIGAGMLLLAVIALFLLLLHYQSSFDEVKTPSLDSSMQFAAKTMPAGSSIYWLGDDSKYNHLSGEVFAPQTDAMQTDVLGDVATNACVNQGYVPGPAHGPILLLVGTYVAPATPPKRPPAYCDGAGITWQVERIVSKPDNEVVVIAVDANDLPIDQSLFDQFVAHLQPFPAGR